MILRRKNWSFFIIFVVCVLTLIFFNASFAFALSPDDIITFTGHGWGHGVGMSQWGAIRQAGAGRSYQTILNSYYSGITYGSSPNNPAMVTLATSQWSVKVTSSLDFKVELGGVVYDFPTANEVWEVRVDEGSYRLYVDGVKKGLYGSPIKFISNGDLLRVVNFKPLAPALAPRYRGTITAQKPLVNSTTLNIVNELPLEAYLYGVVPKEIGGTTPIEAQKAQAVAARTYAVRYGLNKLVASTACQVYGGYDCETAQARSAVDATAGVIMLYNGSVIGAYYHSSSGGCTEDVSKVWGSSQATYPYLKGVSDPYCGADTPNYSWTTTYTVQQLEDRLGSWLLGDLLRLEIRDRGVSGRVTSLAVVGTGGTKIISPEADPSRYSDYIRSLLGLKSSWFSCGKLADITNCWMYPNPFSPNGDGKYDTTSFCYTTAEDANVTIKVYNYKGEVKTVINDAPRKAGRHYEGWTGTNNSGQILPEGNYGYTIYATNSAGTRTYSGTTSINMLPSASSRANIYNCWMCPNPFYPRGTDAKYKTTSFCYSLSQNANVTIKVYNYKGEVKTVVNNSYRAAGRHYEGWTGTNNSGQILPSGNYGYIISATNTAGKRTYSGITAIR